MKVRIIKTDPHRLRLLERNAHYMRHETFQRLVANVKRDDALTSVPFCAILDYYEEGDEIPRHGDGDPIYEVLSGNHRVKAAIAAGQDEIYVMVSDEPIPRQKRLAIQLSHNAIFGEDDPAVLKDIYEDITDVGLRVYSGLDDKTLELLEEVDVSSLSEANLAFQVITFVFLPEEVDAVRAIWEDVETLATGDELWLARWREYDRFLDMLEAASSSHGVMNAATTLMILLDIVARHLDELAEGWAGPDDEVWHTGWVPISTILNTGKMPTKPAARLKRAVQVMMSRGEVDSSERWRALERLADLYLEE